MLFDIANVLNIPQELKNIDRWVCWKAVPSTDGKIAKIPVNPKTLGNASSTDPKSWTTFSQALGSSVASGGTLGIGFVFADDDTIFGLDIDHCVTPEGIDFPAQDILAPLAHTYAEYSTSGTGVHVYAYGPVNKAVKRARGELYGTGRYFTVTGVPLSNVPHTLAECPQALISWLEQELAGVQTPTPGQGKAGAPACYQDIDIDESDDSPPEMDRIIELSDKYPNFYGVWKRKGKKYNSPSEEEMSLARYAISAGWSDQDIYRLLRSWRILHGLEAKHVGAYRLTIFNLHQETPQVQSTSSKLDADSARAVLAEFFPLPIHRLICLGSANGNYRAIVGENQTLLLGPYEELEKQSVWRKVIFQQAGQALDKIGGKKWSAVLAAFAAIIEVEDVPDMAQQAETEQWLEDFTGGVARGELTPELFRRDECFSAGGITHIRLSHMLAHVNRTYGNKASRKDLAERLRVLGWNTKSVSCASQDGVELTKTYWALSAT